MSTPLLTIAVCTYNRADLLNDFLDSLCRQTISLETFSVLVVNNNSTDNTLTVAESYHTRLPRLQVVTEHRQGLSHARNRAVAEVNTPWLAYLDDDAIAAENYVEIALQSIATETFLCFGGAVKAWRRVPLPVWFLDEYESNEHLVLSDQTTLPENQFLFGNNMIFHAALVRELGGFDPRLGMSGTTVAYGEETDLQVRLRAAGHAIGYIPSLIISHYARPEKYTFRSQWLMRYKGGLSWQMLHHDASIRALVAILAKLLLYPAKGAFISLRRLYNGSYRWQNAFLEVTGRFIHTLGRLVGWARLRMPEQK